MRYKSNQVGFDFEFQHMYFFFMIAELSCGWVAPTIFQESSPSSKKKSDLSGEYRPAPGTSKGPPWNASSEKLALNSTGAPSDW